MRRSAPPAPLRPRRRAPPTRPSRPRARTRRGSEHEQEQHRRQRAAAAAPSGTRHRRERRSVRRRGSAGPRDLLGLDVGGSGSSGSSGSGTTTTPTPGRSPSGPSTRSRLHRHPRLDTRRARDAEKLARKAQRQGHRRGHPRRRASTRTSATRDGIWMVWAGRFANESQANDAVRRLRGQGLRAELERGRRRRPKKPKAKTARAPRAPATSLRREASTPAQRRGRPVGRPRTTMCSASSALRRSTPSRQARAPAAAVAEL